MPLSKKVICGAISVVLGTVMLVSTAMAQAAQPGDGKIVRPARATWDTGWFHVEIYNQALQELGYEIKEAKTLGNPFFYQAVAYGEIDFWVNGWFPQHQKYESYFKSGAEVIGYVAKGGALQGYMIDKKTAQEKGIDNLEDLKNAENAALFDSNDDGKADLVSCPPGWFCSEIIEHQLKAYELENLVRPTTATYSAAMADAIARFRNGRSILFYAWTPSWVIGFLKPGEDVVWIEVPFPSLPGSQEKFEKNTTVEHVTGCVDDPCEMGWPANDIRAVANSRFLEKNPAAKRLFEVMRIPLEDIAAQNAKMFQGEDSEEDLKRHASEWITKNRKQFDAWLKEARHAAR